MSTPAGGPPAQSMLAGFRFPAAGQTAPFGESKIGSPSHLGGNPYTYGALPNQFYPHLAHPAQLPVTMTTNEGRYGWPPNPFQQSASLAGPCTGSGSRSVGCEPFVQYQPRYDPYPGTPRSSYNFTPTGLVSPSSGHPLGPPSRFPTPGRLSKKRTHSQSPLADLMDVHALTRHSQGSLNMHPTSLSRCRSTGSSGSYGHLSAGSLGAMSPGTPGGGRRPASLGGSPYYPPPFLPMHPHGPPPPLFASRLEPCVPTSAATGAIKRASSSSKSMDDDYRSYCKTETAEADSQGRIPKEGDPDFVETECHWIGCNKSYEHQDLLVKHVNNEHIGVSKKNFTCLWKNCVRDGKPFKAQYMLVVHMRRHTGEKPHRCTFDGCFKAYSRLENLKTHLRSHTGEKPYPCEHPGCPKAFSNASDRAKHQNRTHSNEKPYVCMVEGCTKRYTDPSSLRKHVKTVHGPEVYATKKHKGESWSNKRNGGSGIPFPGAGAALALHHASMQSPASLSSTQASPALTGGGSHDSPGPPSSQGPVPMQQDALLKNEPCSEDEGVLLGGGAGDGPTATMVRYMARNRGHHVTSHKLGFGQRTMGHSVLDPRSLESCLESELKQPDSTTLQTKSEAQTQAVRDSISTTSSIVSSGLGSLTSGGSDSFFRPESSVASGPQTSMPPPPPPGMSEMAPSASVQPPSHPPPPPPPLPPHSTSTTAGHYGAYLCQRCSQNPCVCVRTWGGYNANGSHMQAYSTQGYPMSHPHPHSNPHPHPHPHPHQQQQQQIHHQPLHQQQQPQPQPQPQQNFYPSHCSAQTYNPWPHSSAPQPQYVWNGSGYSQVATSSSSSSANFSGYQQCVNASTSSEHHIGPFSAQLSGQDGFAWPHNGATNNGATLEDSHVPSVSMENLSFPNAGMSAAPVDTSNMIVNDMQYTMSIYEQETKMLHSS